MSKLNLLSKLFANSQDASRSHKSRDLKLESLEQRQLLAVDVAAALGAAAVDDAPAVLGAAATDGGDAGVVLESQIAADIANAELTLGKDLNGEYSMEVKLPNAVVNNDGETFSYYIDGVGPKKVVINKGDQTCVIPDLKAGNVLTFFKNTTSTDVLRTEQIEAIMDVRQVGNNLVFDFGQVKDADAYMMRYKLSVLPDVHNVWTVVNGVQDTTTDVVTITVNKCKFAQNIEYDYGFAMNEAGTITELDAGDLTVRQLNVPVFTAVADSTTSFDINVIRADANAADYVFTGRIYTPATGWTAWTAPKTMTAAIADGSVVANPDGTFTVPGLPAGAIVQFKVFADGQYIAADETIYLDSVETCRTVALRQVQTLAAPVATVRATGTNTAQVTVRYLDPRAVQGVVNFQVRSFVDGRWTAWSPTAPAALVNGSFDIVGLPPSATIQVRLTALTPNAAQFRNSVAATYCSVLNQVSRLRTPVLVANGVLDRVMYFNSDPAAVGYRVEYMLCGDKGGYKAIPGVVTEAQIQNAKVATIAPLVGATNPGKYYTVMLRITALGDGVFHSNSVAYTTAVVFRGI